MLKYKSLMILLVISSLTLLVWQMSNKVTDVHLTGSTMGTTYNVKVHSNAVSDKQELQQQIDQQLFRINQLMSTYDPQSELSQFNQHQSTEPFPLSNDTIIVLQEAKRLGDLSEGVLDVTVGPLVNLWGFGPDSRPETVPSFETIEQIQGKTGLDKLLIGADNAQKLNPELYVDLSTIAKGYGVDVLANLLEQQGHTNYLVEIGGEMRVAGKKSDDSAWRIAIEKPVTNERVIQSILTIGNNAIASSGDYRNYFEHSGVRYSHLIDPRSGFPITHNLVAVTVVHPSSMTADGLATALNVLGKDDALRIARQHNLDVMLITRENNSYNTYTTGEFDQFIEAAKRP